MRHASPTMLACVSFLLLFVSGARGQGAADQPAEPRDSAPQITVGSKTFTESVVLGELIRQLAEDAGADVNHRRQLGGTQILWQGLLTGEIDVYPEYTGTITEEIFSGESLEDMAAIRDALREHGVRMSRPLGFNNTYALGMTEQAANELGIEKISDLRDHPDLRFGFGNEFMSRGDGWPGLRRTYRLPQEQVRGLDHDLAYRGLASGSIDVMDLYATDAEIRYYDLRVLEDELNYFPEYASVILYRVELEEDAPEVVAAIQRLEQQIDEEQMQSMNARAKLDQVPDARVASDFLKETFGMDVDVRVRTRTDRLIRYTLEHLYLVGISVLAAILLAIPLGIAATKLPVMGQGLLGAVGILQTVPSLVLFVILIPVLGLGATPAIFALFLYSLLPIVRNTYSGLNDIPKEIHESAQALGLPPLARLRLIEMPLAARSIFSGVKIAAVINIGTATLGGFIGAGGYGDPIFTGIRLARTDLILEGAIPAAVMALLAQGIFELIELWSVPRGLRLKAEHR